MYEKHGAPISDDLANSLMGSFHDDSSAMLYEGTTENSFKLAMKVMEMKCCTEHDFDALALGLNPMSLDREKMTLATLKYIRDRDRSIHREVYLSQGAERMKKALEETANDKTRSSDSEKDAVFKDVETMMKRMFANPRVSKEDIVKWHTKVKQAKKELDDDVNARFGQKGGGDGVKVWGTSINAKGDKKQKRKKGLTG